MNLNDLSDRKLIEIIKDERESKFVKNEAGNTLFKRYERQIHKNWWKLCNSLNNSSIVLSLEDEFYSEAYEAFCKAVMSIDLEKIKNDDWKLVGYLDFYLRNARTKISKLVITKGKEKSINNMTTASNEESNTVDPDVEESYYEHKGFKDNPEYEVMEEESERICKVALKECINSWSPAKVKIYNLLIKGTSKLDIAKIMKVSPMRIYTLTSEMKKELKSTIESYY